MIADSSSPPTSEGAAAPLALGAFPHHSLVQLEAFYAPLAMYLSETLQRSVRFGTSSSYARFEARLKRRDFDIVFIDSENYVRLARAAGYIALVRRTAPSTVVFMVAPSSTLLGLADLRGATIAMPPEGSPEARLGLDRLRAAGIDPARDVTVNYLPHHNACIQNVSSGHAAACVTTIDALSFIGADSAKDYRVLDRAGTIPPALFAVAPALSAAERDRLATALIAWPDRSGREGGPANLEWFALERADDAEYDTWQQSALNHDVGDPDATVENGVVDTAPPTGHTSGGR